MKIDRVKEVKAEFDKNWAWAKYGPEKVTPEELVEAIHKDTPFKAKLPEKSDESDNKEGKETPKETKSCC